MIRHTITVMCVVSFSVTVVLEGVSPVEVLPLEVLPLSGVPLGPTGVPLVTTYIKLYYIWIQCICLFIYSAPI